MRRVKGLREARRQRERRDWVVVCDCFDVESLSMESSSLIFFAHRADRFPDGEAWRCGLGNSIERKGIILTTTTL
jgi:hypothetical protein